MDEIHEPLAGIGPVLLLGAKSVGADDQDTVACEASTGETLKAHAHVERPASLPSER